MSDYTLVFIYLIFINLVGFAIMGIDKRRAKRHEWRIPEKVLFGTALAGGALGSWCGMYVFRHKTKHSYFVIGMPAITIAWCALLAFFLFR